MSWLHAVASRALPRALRVGLDLSVGYVPGLSGSRLRLEQEARIIPIRTSPSAEPAAVEDGSQQEGTSECAIAPKGGVVALPEWAARSPCLTWLWLDAGELDLFLCGLSAEALQLAPHWRVSATTHSHCNNISCTSVSRRRLNCL